MALEFTLVAPILALLGLAVLDVVDFLRAGLRLERTAGEVTNVLAQQQSLREEDFATLFDLAARIAAPYRVTDTDGAVVVSGLANQGPDRWSCGSGAPARPAMRAPSASRAGRRRYRPAPRTSCSPSGRARW